jgi:hypothetical protein
MNTAFLLAILAMLAVLGVLALGLFSMVKGGEFNKKYGNKLMQARVILQGLALALLALAWAMSDK